ncbi:MAG: ABC transporter ATP-binding protein [Haloferacaceae archaeon]
MTVDQIRALGLRKEFPGVVAVDGVDLEIREGEFFALLGPSGCGKTTTLRMIAGFETPTEGTVEINGTDVTDAPPEARPTNMVFQDLALFTHMDVFENVAYGLRRSGVAEEEIEARVAEALELVDLPGYGDRDTAALSGGQQQRIALARALANETDVILLDEPLASLDRKLRQRMQLELRTIHEEVGVTFFYVTHDQQAAMTMADRMAVMNDGEIEQVAPPSEVYDAPANQFVADFIGDMNSLSGTVEDGRFVTEGGLEFAVENDGVTGDADLVIRPEKFHISADGSLGLANEVEGTIRDAVFRGTSTRYRVEIDDGVEVEIESQNRTREPPYASGDRVRVGWEPGSALVYETR